MNRSCSYSARGRGPVFLRKSRRGQHVHLQAAPAPGPLNLNGAHLQPEKYVTSLESSSKKILTSFTFPAALCAGEVSLTGAPSLPTCTQYHVVLRAVQRRCGQFVAPAAADSDSRVCSAKRPPHTAIPFTEACNTRRFSLKSILQVHSMAGNGPSQCDE